MREASPRAMDKVVGDRVKQVREDKGSTQDQLARRMRVYGFDWQQNTVSAVENGRRAVSLPELAYLAWWGDKDVGWFLDADGPVLMNDETVLAGRILARMARGQEVSGRDVPIAALERIIHSGKAEQHAGKRLGIGSDAVGAAAVRKWGQSLTEERDRRVAEQAVGLPDRSVQALRGHVTRQLIAELEGELTPKSTKRNTTKKGTR